MEPGKRHEWLISDDEEEEPAINLIPEDSDSSDTIEAPDQQDSPPPRPTLNLDLSLSKYENNFVFFSLTVILIRCVFGLIMKKRIFS